MVAGHSIIGVIQARIGSTRLPAKVLAPIVDSLPLIAVLVKRVRPAGIPLWLATTNLQSDDVTASWGHELGLRVFRGDSEDVLSRFAAIVAKTDADWVVRFTADDPFTDAGITTRAIEVAMAAPRHVDLLTEGPSRQFPLGYVPQVVRATAISRLANTLPMHGTHHRVHVTTGVDGSRTAAIQDPDLPVRPHWRWTVDTPEDLAMAQTAFAATGRTGILTQYREFVDLLDQRTDITDINRVVEQKALTEG